MTSICPVTANNQLWIILLIVYLRYSICLTYAAVLFTKCQSYWWLCFIKTLSPCRSSFSLIIRWNEQIAVSLVTCQEVWLQFYTSFKRIELLLKPLLHLALLRILRRRETVVSDEAKRHKLSYPYLCTFCTAPITESNNKVQAVVRIRVCIFVKHGSSRQMEEKENR